jgi:DNA-binding IclR family transcriptional regulator
MSENSKSTAGVAAVNRALLILDAFRQSSGVLSLKEIAEATGLYKSTVLRLFGSLESFGYIRRLENGSYHLGPKLAELAAVYQDSFNLQSYVMPALETIVAETNESATFYLAEGRSRVCLFRVETSQVIRDHIRVGDALPLDKGASGKALMAFETGLKKPIGVHELVFTSSGERHPEMAAVAAPVFGLGGKLIGALNASGPKMRFTAKALKQFCRIVEREAVALSIRLGASEALFLDREP